MALIVQKYGGTSVGNPDRIKNVARRVAGYRSRGDQIVVIGDTAHDIRCGRFIGAKVLAVATGGVTLGELKSHRPDWAVESLSRVTAKEIVSSN